MRKILYFLTTLTILFGCTKTTTEEIIPIPDGELLGKQLLQIAKENNIDKAYVVLNSFWDNNPSEIAKHKTEFVIKGQFIVFDHGSYNLNKLLKYKIVEEAEENVFRLYFEGIHY